MPHSRLPLTPFFLKSTFYDGTLILKKHTTGWIVNRFFYESCGKNYDFLRTTILERWKGEDPTQLGMPLERTIQRVFG